MLIRDARAADLPAVLEIMNDAILNTTAIYEYEIRTLDFIEDWFIKKQKSKEPLIVCTEENNILGYGTYGQFRPRPAYQFSVEHSVYVKTGFQRQGIGSSILNALIGLAQKQGYHTLIAGIDASNHSSYEFHRRFGFIEVARFKEVGYKFDRWLDLIFMQRML
jgi:phosphinothricin acetyltransferase